MFATIVPRKKTELKIITEKFRRISLISLIVTASFVFGPLAQAVTLGFSGSTELLVFDINGTGDEIGSVFLDVTGSFDYDSAGVENPANPGEYVAVASSPVISIYVSGLSTYGSNTPEQDQIVFDFADLSFPVDSTFDYVGIGGQQNNIGEAFVAANNLYFGFPSNPGNNTIALLETMDLDLSSILPFSPATLAGATQALLAASNPNDILSSATLSYSGPIFDTELPVLDQNQLFFPNVTIGISAIPVPAAIWLFGSALGLLGWVRRGSVQH